MATSPPALGALSPLLRPSLAAPTASVAGVAVTAVLAGTNTVAPMFTDAGGTTAVTSVQSDSNGQVPTFFTPLGVPGDLVAGGTVSGGSYSGGNAFRRKVYPAFATGRFWDVQNVLMPVNPRRGFFTNMNPNNDGGRVSAPLPVDSTMRDPAYRIKVPYDSSAITIVMDPDGVATGIAGDTDDPTKWPALRDDFTGEGSGGIRLVTGHGGFAPLSTWSRGDYFPRIAMVSESLEMSSGDNPPVTVIESLRGGGLMVSPIAQPSVNQGGKKADTTNGQTLPLTAGLTVNLSNGGGDKAAAYPAGVRSALEVVRNELSPTYKNGSTPVQRSFVPVAGFAYDGWLELQGPGWNDPYGNSGATAADGTGATAVPTGTGASDGAARPLTWTDYRQPGETPGTMSSVQQTIAGRLGDKACLMASDTGTNRVALGLTAPAGIATGTTRRDAAFGLPVGGRLTVALAPAAPTAGAGNPNVRPASSGTAAVGLTAAGAVAFRLNGTPDAASTGEAYLYVNAAGKLVFQGAATAGVLPAATVLA